MRYLEPPEVDLFLQDLRDGPSRRFRRVVVRYASDGINVDSLAAAQQRLIDDVPELADRVRRDQGGWRYEPCPVAPEVYVETHQIDIEDEAARTRLNLERDRPLDPVMGPLIRISVLRYRSGDAHLLLALHELAARMRSSRAVMRSLLAVATPVSPPAG